MAHEIALPDDPPDVLAALARVQSLPMDARVWGALVLRRQQVADLRQQVAEAQEATAVWQGRAKHYAGAFLDASHPAPRIDDDVPDAPEVQAPEDWREALAKGRVSELPEVREAQITRLAHFAAPPPTPVHDASINPPSRPDVPPSWEHLTPLPEPPPPQPREEVEREYMEELRRARLNSPADSEERVQLDSETLFEALATLTGTVLDMADNVRAIRGALAPVREGT